MRIKLALFAAAAMTAEPGPAGSQSSNTSLNSSSNNGVVRERTVDTYCDNDYCRRWIERVVYRDDQCATAGPASAITAATAIPTIGTIIIATTTQRP